MTHIVFIENGQVRQCSNPSSVPRGTSYWHVKPEEKDWMDNNRDKRDAWQVTPDREADGVGE